jgi:Flp pilus assembly protein TadG
MKKLSIDRSSERGGAAVKFLLVFLVLAVLANAGINYIPVAYEGASFRQEMDTAVVKGLSASGRLKPLEVVQASVQKAYVDYNLPEDAFVEIKPVNGVVEAHVVYTRRVNVLPFGIYKYDYNFDHVARPVGYLLKQ